jgi:hypothetical protein
MEDSYLWDGSGEPNPNIQELEQILGQLRYQPKPLEIPANLAIRQRRSFFAMAIAAAVGLLVVAAGIWIFFQRSQAVLPARATTNPPVKQDTIKPNSDANDVATSQKPAPRKEWPDISRRLVAVNRNRRERRAAKETELTAQEQADKEQVLAALRLVTAKLSFAQRKAQGAPVNTIRNQHRIG